MASTRSSDGPERVVRLWILEVPMFIVEHPSGVAYLQQAGGRMIQVKQIEGVLVPFAFEWEALLRDLSSAFRDRRIHRFDEAIACEVDALLARYSLPQYVVERKSLSDSTPGWVYLEFDSPEESNKENPFVGFGKGRGVLVWPT